MAGLCNQTVLNEHNLMSGGGGADYPKPPTDFSDLPDGPEREWQAYDEDVLKGL